MSNLYFINKLYKILFTKSKLLEKYKILLFILSKNNLNFNIFIYFIIKKYKS